MSTNSALPSPSPLYSPADQAALRAAIRALDTQNVKIGQNIDMKTGGLFLYSPNGDRWQITVSNTGTLSAVAA